MVYVSRFESLYERQKDCPRGVKKYSESLPSLWMTHVSQARLVSRTSSLCGWPCHVLTEYRWIIVWKILCIRKVCVTWLQPTIVQIIDWMKSYGISKHIYCLVYKTSKTWKKESASFFKPSELYNRKLFLFIEHPKIIKLLWFIRKKSSLLLQMLPLSSVHFWMWDDWNWNDCFVSISLVLQLPGTKSCQVYNKQDSSFIWSLINALTILFFNFIIFIQARIKVLIAGEWRI